MTDTCVKTLMVSTHEERGLDQESPKNQPRVAASELGDREFIIG